VGGRSEKQRHSGLGCPINKSGGPRVSKPCLGAPAGTCRSKKHFDADIRLAGPDYFKTFFVPEPWLAQPGGPQQVPGSSRMAVRSAKALVPRCSQGAAQQGARPACQTSTPYSTVKVRKLAGGAGQWRLLCRDGSRASWRSHLAGPPASTGEVSNTTRCWRASYWSRHRLIDESPQLTSDFALAGTNVHLMEALSAAISGLVPACGAIHFRGTNESSQAHLRARHEGPDGTSFQRSQQTSASATAWPGHPMP